MSSDLAAGPAALRRLESDALARGVPSALVARAVRILSERMAASPGEWDARRQEAYFWGVVRRSAMRGGEATRELRRRFIEASEPTRPSAGQMKLAV